ncbi:MAG: hypothetical protein SFY80_04900 [Verrucomicrobiota bacterium]|nr:hypothetical protein [Verrucomicrobiota bacterium]
MDWSPTIFLLRHKGQRQMAVEEQAPHVIPIPIIARELTYFLGLLPRGYAVSFATLPYRVITDLIALARASSPCVFPRSPWTRAWARRPSHSLIAQRTITKIP